MRIHPGEKPHKRKLCLDVFPQKRNLHEPSKTDDEESSYTVKLCEERSEQTADLNVPLETDEGENDNLQVSTMQKSSLADCETEQTKDLTVALKTNGGENKQLEFSEHQKSSFGDSDSFLVKPFGCVFCDEMFQVEIEFKGHCVQVCYFPVEDDYAELL